jgi:hypothetical protein
MVELVALRRVGGFQWWDAMDSVSGWFRKFRRLTLRSAPGRLQRDPHHQKHLKTRAKTKLAAARNLPHFRGSFP